VTLLACHQHRWGLDYSAQHQWHDNIQGADELLISILLMRVCNRWVARQVTSIVSLTPSLVSSAFGWHLANQPSSNTCATSSSTSCRVYEKFGFMVKTFSAASFRGPSTPFTSICVPNARLSCMGPCFAQLTCPGDH